MGIKFECPNGHRLHVKSFLAGKRAKCPHCNAKVMVPVPSGAASAPPDQEQSQAYTPPPPPMPSLPSAFHEPPPVTAQPALQVEPAWFVRPPGGGQFGPAEPRLFEQWQQEGRVPDDALVWQEGWPEWRRAAEVCEAVERPVVAANDEELLTSRGRTTSGLRHPRKKDYTVLVIALLSAASLVLLFILLWVLNRTG